MNIKIIKGVLIACRFTGLIVHGGVVLPLLYFICTRKNPITYARGMVNAYLVGK